RLNRDPDKVAKELDERLRSDLRKTGDFARIHPMPRSGAEVPDDLDARMVVLSAEHSYSKEPGNAAETTARTILESRGNTPRLYRNTLVFLAADKVRLQDLDEAVRRFLAWKSILEEKQALNLDPHQEQQAETQKRAADGAVTARLPETYQWCWCQSKQIRRYRSPGKRSDCPRATPWPRGRARGSAATSRS